MPAADGLLSGSTLPGSDQTLNVTRLPGWLGGIPLPSASPTTPFAAPRPAIEGEWPTEPIPQQQLVASRLPSWLGGPTPPTGLPQQQGQAEPPELAAYRAKYPQTAPTPFDAAAERQRVGDATQNWDQTTNDFNRAQAQGERDSLDAWGRLREQNATEDRNLALNFANERANEEQSEIKRLLAPQTPQGRAASRAQWWDQNHPGKYLAQDIGLGDRKIPDPFDAVTQSATNPPGTPTQPRNLTYGDAMMLPYMFAGNPFGSATRAGRIGNMTVPLGALYGQQRVLNNIGADERDAAAQRANDEANAQIESEDRSGYLKQLGERHRSSKNLDWNLPQLEQGDQEILSGLNPAQPAWQQLDDMVRTGQITPDQRERVGRYAATINRLSAGPNAPLDDAEMKLYDALKGLPPEEQRRRIDELTQGKDVPLPSWLGGKTKTHGTLPQEVNDRISQHLATNAQPKYILGEQKAPGTWYEPPRLPGPPKGYQTPLGPIQAQQNAVAPTPPAAPLDAPPPVGPGGPPGVPIGGEPQQQPPLPGQAPNPVMDKLPGDDGKPMAPEQVRAAGQNLSEMLERHGVGGLSEVARLSPPPPGFEGYWSRLDSTSKIMVIAGLSLAAVSLFKSLMGKDEGDDDPSMLWSILPFLGVGAAAWGAGGGTFSQLPSMENYKRLGGAITHNVGSLGSFFGGGDKAKQ